MKIIKSLEDSERRLMFAIIAGALLLRLLYIIEIIKTPFVNSLFSDSQLFIASADSFFSAAFWSGTDPFIVSPLYPLVLAVFRMIFGDNNFVIYLIQILVSSLTLIFIYLTAKNIFDKNVALISLLIASLFDSYIFYSGLILSETFEIFLISLLFYYLSDKSNFIQAKKWFTIGLILGALILLRECILIIALTLIIYCSLDRKIFLKSKISKGKIIFSIVGGVFLLVLPFTITNLIVSNEFILTNASEGIYFNFANSGGSNGLNPRDSHNFEEDPLGKEIASNFLGRKVSAGEASNYFYGKTFDDISDEPVKFLSLLAQKSVLFFDPQHFPKSSIMDLNFYEENFSDILKLPLVSYGLISILFLIGFTLYLKTQNKNVNNFTCVIFVLFCCTFFICQRSIQIGDYSDNDYVRSIWNC